MKGKYIYGIIKGDGNLNIPIKGLFNKRALTVNYKSISAVISDAPLKTYESDQEGLLAHNRVLAEVMKYCTVLPLRFGTVARNAEEVQSLLQGAYTVLLDKLVKVKDKFEFDLAVTVTNEQIILNEILEKNKDIQALRNKLVSQGAQVEIQDKILIGRMMAAKVTLHKAGLLKNVLTALRPYYSQDTALTGKGLLANLAFLVPLNRIEKFEAAIYQLGDKFGDRLKFKYAGPLAPYSFVGLKLLLVNFASVNQARQELELAERATITEIKDAYRRLARQCHPDKYPDDGLKEEEFKRIAGAYKLLTEYCRHYPKNHYLFEPGEISEFSVLAEGE